MNKKVLLDEIINLKERRAVLEAECGTTTHNMNCFSRKELHQMDEDTQKMNACIALDIVNSMIDKDETLFRQE